MIEIRDTFRGGEDAEIETPKASRGKGTGRGIPSLSPRHPPMGSMGERPKRGPGRPKMDFMRFELNRTHL